MRVTASRKWFNDTGTTIAHWAAANDFSLGLVYAVVSGRIKGTRGDAFLIRKMLTELAGEEPSIAKAAPSASAPER